MGLDSAAVEFLCAAKSMGVDFSSTLMVGRQQFFPQAETLARMAAVLGLQFDAASLLKESPYSEPFFSLLGAGEIASLDASDYESASRVHDLNAPLPDDLVERFSLVFDGGTLEHVFNLPQAYANCMRMVRVGGHFAQVTVANNFMGHGFWQISPELIFRVFSPENGFRTECVLLHEVVPNGAWYVVRDPQAVGGRVELVNSVPTYILTLAKRTERAEIFAKPPQQSDYVTIWDGDEASGAQALARDTSRFDEDYYLQANPDVARAVKAGAFRSGRAHFLAFGRKEGRKGSPGYRRISVDDLMHGRLPRRSDT